MKRFSVRLSALTLGVLLVACSNEPGSVNDVHTGVTASHSKMYPAASGLLNNLNAAAVVGSRNNETKYAVATRYTSTGLGWAFFREAWSFGTKLPFTSANERVLGCSGGSCSHIEDGLIELTPEQFRAASKNGLQFKLVGKNQSIVGNLPATAFQAALLQHQPTSRRQ